MDFHNYGNGNVFRAYRYGPDYPGLVDKDLIPGLNISLNPNQCNIYGCTDANACNYNEFATDNNESCFFIGDTCDDNDSYTLDDEIQDDCECAGTPVSTLDELEVLSVLIYPNPVSNNLTVDLGDLNGVNTTIKLYDSSSKLVFEKQSTSTLMIDVSGFAKGMYSLELATDEQVLRSQVIIE